MVLRAASLFSGVGGLDLGLELALPGTRCVVYIERDAYAAATLVARMEDKALDQAPVCADITTFDGRPWRGAVDILVGGFPCQDISVAGRGEGIEGKRSGLWSEIVRLADEIRPRFLFLENVAAITSRGLDTVLADLASLGFDAEWLCLRASDVGAPHRRERWFCLAHRDIERSRLERLGAVERPREHDAAQRHDVDGCGEAMANPPHDHGRRGECGEKAETRQDQKWGRGSAICERELDDPIIQRPQGEQSTGAAARATERAGGVFPPGPSDEEAWRRILEEAPHLAPAVEPDVCRVADGMAERVDEFRTDRLRCCGNGVVPLQAAVVLRELLRRVYED